jgi:hypothetical protein
MNGSVVALSVLNLFFLIVIFTQARSSLFGRFAGSAVNPLIVFWLCAFLFNVDFAVVWSNSIIDYLGEVYFVSEQAVFGAYVVFTANLGASCLGFSLALNLSMWERSIGEEHRQASERVSWSASCSARILLGVTLAIATPVLFKAFLEVAAAAPGTRNYQAAGHESAWPTIMGWLLPYVLAMYLAHTKPVPPIGVASAILAAALIGISGEARGPILLIGLVMAISFVTDGRRIWMGWYLLATPVGAVVLSILRYVFREVEKYSSYWAFVTAKGGYIGLFFGGEEVGFAKGLSVVVQNAKTLAMAPFESYLGLAMFPAPRSIFWFKPVGASSRFTQQLAPDRWEWTKSESLVTGFGDLYLQFGTFCSALVMFVIAFFWLRACIGAIRSNRCYTVALLPVLIWGMCMFMRGDIFNLGFVLWPALLVFGAQRALKSVLELTFTTHGRHREAI